LHGGYGFMTEYPISKIYSDAAIQTIFGGSTEIMKEIIGRALGLGDPRSNRRTEPKDGDR
jgi:alkylation response protein AidB-like acyl-CoA dehydrogenase